MSKRKIRILETIRQGQIGGGETHLLDLVDQLDKTEFEPIVLSFTEGPMVARLRQAGISVRVIPSTRPFDLPKWRAVETFIRQQQVDLVHAHGTRACSNVFWAAQQLRLPLVYTIHGWSFNHRQSWPTRTLRRWGEQLLTQRSVVNISVSASNQQTGFQALRQFKSVVINNGIDCCKFDPARDFPDLRAEAGIPAQAVVFLFVARFTEQKQPLLLLRAFARISEQNPHLHLWLVGDGEQAAAVRAWAEALPCRSQITISSFRQDVPALLAAADAYVLPSLWEGLSIALLEAMSMGKAIIATATDGTRELIRHSENGLLVGWEATEAELAQTMAELGADARRRQQLGTAARQTIVGGFDAASMTRAVETVYRQLTPY